MTLPEIRRDGRITCKWCHLSVMLELEADHIEWHRANDLHGSECSLQDRMNTYYRCACGLR